MPQISLASVYMSFVASTSASSGGMYLTHRQTDRDASDRVLPLLELSYAPPLPRDCPVPQFPLQTLLRSIIRGQETMNPISPSSPEVTRKQRYPAPANFLYKGCIFETSRPSLPIISET